MFKEIKTLRNFGAYKTFAWPNAADMRAFSKFNLFYGWNYSGKTTISRFFDCLRVGRLDEPFQKATFHVTRDDGTSINEQGFQPDPTIRVFNVDYVRRNLRWDQPNDGLEPVFILGEENLALQTRFEEISKLLMSLRAVSKSADDQRVQLERTLNQRLTDEARKVKQRLWADRNEAFERPRLQKAIEGLAPEHVSEQLTDERYAEESATRKLAEFPTRFHVENVPHAPFLLVPKVSSERRRFIPMGFMQPDTLCSDLVFIIPHATLYHFGVLGSTMHMAWVRYTCGRLESRYRYSKDIVYNNFPWPRDLDGKRIKAIEEAAQGVLDARVQFPNSTLADLYDPLTMPPELTKAHQALDRAVDAAYGKKSFASDAERVAFLFELYQQYTSLLPSETKSQRRRKS